LCEVREAIEMPFGVVSGVAPGVGGVSISQLAHAADKPILYREGWQRGFSEVTFGRTYLCCADAGFISQSRWRWRYGNGNKSSSK